MDISATSSIWKSQGLCLPKLAGFPYHLSSPLHIVLLAQHNGRSLLVSQTNYYSLHVYTIIYPTVPGCSRTNVHRSAHEAQHRVTLTMVNDRIVWGNAVEVGDDEG